MLAAPRRESVEPRPLSNASALRTAPSVFFFGAKNSREFAFPEKAWQLLGAVRGTVRGLWVSRRGGGAV